MPDLKMPDINNVLIAGNVTAEPSLRKTTSGIQVANFYIASNRKYRDNSGIWRENVCHVGVVAWHKLAEVCMTTLKSGSSILVDGELQSRSWKTDDGSTKSVVEIRARRIQFLEQGAPKDIEEMTSIDDEEKGELPASKESPQTQFQQIEPTEFDFGYQNLKM
ncbi:MAG: single-stranded DNA-binding protein [Calditrichaeota bacterium]|nr:MAG: single-stranded DNA-binding protein [Calditrichota bacterium]